MTRFCYHNFLAIFRPIVIVDDLSQQQQNRQLANHIEVEKVNEQLRNVESVEKKDTTALKETKEASDKRTTKEVGVEQMQQILEQASSKVGEVIKSTVESEQVKKHESTATEAAGASGAIDKYAKVAKENLHELKSHTAVTNKPRNSQFLGTPVTPPTVPQMEKASTKLEHTTEGDKESMVDAALTVSEVDSEKIVTVNENATEMNEPIKATTITTENIQQVKHSDKISDITTAAMLDRNYQTSVGEVCAAFIKAEQIDMQNTKPNEPNAVDHTEAVITANQVSNKATAATSEENEVQLAGQQPSEAVIKHTIEAVEVVDATSENKMEREEQAEKVESKKVLPETHAVSESKIETAQTTTTSSSSANNTSQISETHTEHKSEERVEQKSEVKSETKTSETKSETRQSTQKVAHTKTTTTKKQVIKSTTSTSQLHESAGLDTLDGLPEELRKMLEAGGAKITSVTSSTTPLSPTINHNLVEQLNKPIAFTLQPYAERVSAAGTPRITVFEERQFESKQNAYTEIRTRDATGEEKVQTSTESHKERAKLKKVHSHDDELDQLGIVIDADGVAADKCQPMTITASAETRISELAENPQDKQSIERGILNLSESGKQLQRSEAGGVEYMECEHQVQDSYEDVEQVLGGESVDENAKKPTLLRELSETLTVTKDGEKQVTRRSETTKETPKKGAKLLKKSDDERRLEFEAQKLIESYQKVKKEAEKLFQHELCEEEGFDFGDDKQRKHQENVTSQVETVNEKVESETEFASSKEVKCEESMEDVNLLQPKMEVRVAEKGQRPAVQVQDISEVDVSKHSMVQTEQSEIKQEIPPGSKQLSTELSNLDATKLTAGFLAEERKFTDQERVLLERKVVVEGKKIAVNNKKETTRPAIPTSVSPDLLDNEPIYVLHKNIIEAPKVATLSAEPYMEPALPDSKDVIEIQEVIVPTKTEVELPQKITQFETVDININLPTSTEKAKPIAEVNTTSAPKSPPMPPIPQKREHKSTESTNRNKAPTPATATTNTPTPTPKKRGSIELHGSTTAEDHTTSAAKLQTTKLEIPINKQKLQQNLSDAAATQPKLERIIVGVEQQQFDDTTNNSKQSAIINLASEDLPTEIAVNTPKQVVADVLSTSSSGGANGSELHLETINLPNEPQNTTNTLAEKLRKTERVGDGMQMTKTTIPTTASTTFVSTSSSADSVQSVIEVGGIVESPSEDEVTPGITRDASEEGE